MKNSNDTIGNRTCDFPAFSVVPQPTAPPRTHSLYTGSLFYLIAVVCLFPLLLHYVRGQLSEWAVLI